LIFNSLGFIRLPLFWQANVTCCSFFALNTKMWITFCKYIWNIQKYDRIFVRQKQLIMNTVKNILTENRDSVISSIKYAFKVWKTEDVKVKMIEFLAYAEENLNIAAYEETKAKKTYLKNLVNAMQMKQQKAYNLKRFGTETPKLRDIMGAIAEREEEAGNVWNPITSTWEKK